MITTKDELIRWVAEHYFASWEIENAEKIAKESGVQAGIQYLVDNDLGRGYCGPGNPGYRKPGKTGKVECRYPETRVTEPPDLLISLASLCRLILDDPQQPRLL